MSDVSVFNKMEESFSEVTLNIKKYHGEYFIAGLFLGLNKPSLGWALLSLVSFLPTLIVVKKSEWVSRFQEERVEHVILFALLLLSSGIYATHCFTMALGF
jgi:hypothetical protein